MVLTEANRPAVAEFHYYRALKLSGTRDPSVLANLALCLKNQGKMPEARALYEESLAAAPDTLHTLMGLARLEEADRHLDAALALLDRAEALSADNPNILLLRAMVLGRQGETAAALAALERLAAAKPTFAPAELLEKGRLLDRMGRYDEAFAAFDAGKERLRAVTGKPISPRTPLPRSAGCGNSSSANAWRNYPVLTRAPMWRSPYSCSAFRARAPPCWNRP